MKRILFLHRSFTAAEENLFWVVSGSLRTAEHTQNFLCHFQKAYEFANNWNIALVFALLNTFCVEA